MRAKRSIRSNPFIRTKNLRGYNVASQFFYTLDSDSDLRRRKRKAESSGEAFGSERSETTEKGGEEAECERSEAFGRILLSAPKI